MRRPPTMEDVARKAGVGRSTVSRVFQNDGRRVSPATQIRIHEAAEHLGYVHNLVASGLALRRGHELGLLVRDASNPAYGHLHAELHRVAETAGRTLIAVTADRDDYGTAEVSGLRRLLGLRVAGVFAATGVTAAEDLARTVHAVPLLIVGRPDQHPLIDSVSYDEAHHGRRMAEEIADRGHRRIGVLRAPVLYSRVFDLRTRALSARCRELGVETVALDLLPVEQGVVRALDAAADERLSCIVCPVDYVALDLLRAAAARGVAVPGDVSVVGFDGVTDGLDLLGLATWRLPVAGLARAALGRMHDLIAAAAHAARDPEVPPTPRAVRHDVLAGEFVPGRTLGSPPR